MKYGKVFLFGSLAIATPPACLLGCINVVSRICALNQYDMPCLCQHSNSMMACITDTCWGVAYISARYHYRESCLEHNIDVGKVDEHPHFTKIETQRSNIDEENIKNEGDTESWVEGSNKEEQDSEDSTIEEQDFEEQDFEEDTEAPNFDYQDCEEQDFEAPSTEDQDVVPEKDVEEQYPQEQNDQDVEGQNSEDQDVQEDSDEDQDAQKDLSDPNNLVVPEPSKQSDPEDPEEIQNRFGFSNIAPGNENDQLNQSENEKIPSCPGNDQFLEPSYYKYQSLECISDLCQESMLYQSYTNKANHETPPIHCCGGDNHQGEMELEDYTKYTPHNSKGLPYSNQYLDRFAIPHRHSMTGMPQNEQEQGAKIGQDGKCHLVRVTHKIKKRPLPTHSRPFVGHAMSSDAVEHV